MNLTPLELQEICSAMFEGDKQRMIGKMYKNLAIARKEENKKLVDLLTIDIETAKKI